MDTISQDNIIVLTNWEPRSHARIYLDYSPLHAGSVDLDLNPATGHIPPQFHVVIDDELSTVRFMREVTIYPNWTDIVQRISQIGTPDNIDLKDTWFTTDLEEYPIESPSHEPSIASENINNMLNLSQPIPQV